MFRRENFALLDSGGFRLVLERKRVGDREYAASALASCYPLQFGRFEIEMKATKAEGVVSAFFLHRNNPWQELDVEFLGRDTTKLLTNVYFNPGDPGMKLNHGNRGTPIIVNLGFDAADDFHCYAIEWEPHEIRWFVDNKLVHVRSAWEPTPVPNLPMRLYCSLWAPRAVDLAGELKNSDIPVSTDVRHITIFAWRKALVGQDAGVGGRS
jgi:beta-glucanase (GH16 family)